MQEHSQIHIVGLFAVPCYEKDSEGRFTEEDNTEQKILASFSGSKELMLNFHSIVTGVLRNANEDIVSFQIVREDFDTGKCEEIPLPFTSEGFDSIKISDERHSLVIGKPLNEENYE